MGIGIYRGKNGADKVEKGTDIDFRIVEQEA
jgi:hypothetical protein